MDRPRWTALIVRAPVCRCVLKLQGLLPNEDKRLRVACCVCLTIYHSHWAGLHGGAVRGGVWLPANPRPGGDEDQRWLPRCALTLPKLAPSPNKDERYLTTCMLLTCMPTCLPTCLPTYLPTYLTAYLLTYLPAHLPTYWRRARTKMRGTPADRMRGGVGRVIVP